MPWTIYCHIHIATGRRYVGLTFQTMLRRWNQHVSKSKSSKGGRWHFPNAIRKYSKDAFDHEVLEVCDTLEEANEAEERWIGHFGTRDPEKGFNLARGGEHVPHSFRNPWDRPEYREKSLVAAKRRWEDPEYRAKIVSANTGKTLSPETRGKIAERTRASNSRRVVSQDTRDRISASMAARYAKRDSIACKRHGVVDVGDCYQRRSKSGKEGARLVCKKCVREQNRARRSRVRLQNGGKSVHNCVPARTGSCEGTGGRT